MTKVGRDREKIQIIMYKATPDDETKETGSKKKVENMNMKYY